MRRHYKLMMKDYSRDLEMSTNYKNYTIEQKLGDRI